MTVVTIKKVERGSTLSREAISKAFAEYYAVHPRPKSLVVKVKHVNLNGSTKKLKSA